MRDMSKNKRVIHRNMQRRLLDMGEGYAQRICHSRYDINGAEPRKRILVTELKIT